MVVLIRASFSATTFEIIGQCHGRTKEKTEEEVDNVVGNDSWERP